LEKEFPKVVEIPQIHPEIRENTKRKRERERYHHQERIRKMISLKTKGDI
jgi:hypothetical protein